MNTNKKIGRWKASRILLSKSWEIFRNQKNLLMFPLWSFLTSLVALVVIGLLTLIATIGTGFLTTFSEIANLESVSNFPLFIGGIITAIVLQMIATYFNAGIIQSTNEYLSGKMPSNKESLNAIKRKQGVIFGWAAINASIGIILRQISERSRLLGRLVSTLIGAAWSIATYFILPILVLEDSGIKSSAKKSTQLIHKTWGEAFLANIGVGLAMIGFALLGFIPFILAIISGNGILITTAGIFLFLYMTFVSLVSSVLNTIIKVILYRYASDMLLPEAIDTQVIGSIFKNNK